MPVGPSSPVVAALVALMSGVDGPLRGHLVEALTKHHERCVRSPSVHPSADIAALIAALRVDRNGQSPPDHGDVAGLGDDAGVQRDALDYRTAGDRLSVSDRTVSRLVKRGDIRAVDIGGCRRIRTTDLDAYLDGLSDDSETRDGQ